MKIRMERFVSAKSLASLAKMESRIVALLL